MNPRVWPVVFIVALAATTAGCAFGTRSVTLAYPPPGRESAGEAFASPAAAPPIERAPVVLQTFLDQRTDKSVIGEVRNGWGMRTADVVSDSNIAEWITDAIAKELAREGVRVIREGSAEGPTDPVITGEVLTVYAKALFSYEGEVSFFATIRKADREIVRKRYSGNGSAGMNWAATGDSYGESLSIALQAAVRNLVPDISAILGRD